MSETMWSINDTMRDTRWSVNDTTSETKWYINKPNELDQVIHLWHNEWDMNNIVPLIVS
jgi:hypothetical protein